MLKLSEIDNLKLLESLANVYISIFLFDIKNDELIAIKSNDFIDMWADQKEGAQAKTNIVMDNIALPEHRKTMYEFDDFSTLNARLDGKNDISVVFAGKFNGWCRARFIVVDREEDGSIRRALHVVECIDEEKKRENHLLYLAQTDLMTDINNRGYGERRIRECLNDGTEGAFCLFDVDHFKAINDLYGHNTGDKVLVAIAEAMKAIKREQDIAMRLGGDEFAMYLTGVMTRDEVEKYIRRLFALVENICVDISILKQQVSLSLGVSFYCENTDFDTLYKQADKGVYTSKRRVGNAISFN